MHLICFPSQAAVGSSLNVDTADLRVIGAILSTVIGYFVKTYFTYASFPWKYMLCIYQFQIFICIAFISFRFSSALHLAQLFHPLYIAFNDGS